MAPANCSTVGVAATQPIDDGKSSKGTPNKGGIFNMFLQGGTMYSHGASLDYSF